jgi:hypothetical protein
LWGYLPISPRQAKQNAHWRANPALCATRRWKRISRRLANALDLKRLHVNVYEIDPINGLAAPMGKSISHADF